MPGSCLNLRRGFLQIKKSSTTGRTADELRLGNTHSRSLEQVKRRFAQLIRREIFCIPEQTFTHSIHEETAEVRRCLNDNIILVFVVFLGIVEPKHGGNGFANLQLPQLRKESSGKESPAMPVRRFQQNESWRCLFKHVLHLILRLLPGKHNRIAAQSFWQLVACSYCIRSHEHGCTLGNVGAGFAKNTCRHVQQGFELHTGARGQHTFNHHSIHALPILLHIAISTKSQPEPVAKSSSIQASQFFH
mmetsp:Transcript_60383/g.141332  ORF Transcript_60383/g.141332 Transcript_60383/m.141332 type:complete len:247 (+) Transcript_60383:421-1161(+)